MKNPVNHNRQNEMFALVKSSLGSDTTRNEFFKRHGITAHTYYYWYRKYMNSKNITEDTFIPIDIPQLTPTHPKIKEPEQNITVSKKTELEISYPNGVKVKLTQELDLTMLRSLISIM
jgi:transposase-like protein